MDKLVLYCKSYSNDVDRVKILLDSINTFNKDKLPFYISTPKYTNPRLGLQTSPHPGCVAS